MKILLPCYLIFMLFDFSVIVIILFHFYISIYIPPLSSNVVIHTFLLVFFLAYFQTCGCALTVHMKCDINKSHRIQNSNETERNKLSSSIVVLQHDTNTRGFALTSQPLQIRYSDKTSESVN